MIEEIINYTKEVAKEVKILPPNGLNILIKFEEDGTPKLKYGIYPVKVEVNFLETDDNFFNKCANYYQYSATNIQRNNRFDNPNCANAAFNPFSLSYKKDYFLDIDNKLSNLTWDTYISNFFKKAKSFYKDYEENKKYIDLFEKYCINKFQEDINKFLIELEEYNNTKAKKKQKISLKNDALINIFLENIDIEIYKTVQDFVIKKVGSVGNEDAEFQSSATLSKYPDCKPFLNHFTALFKEGYKITNEQNKLINEFFSKVNSRTFPRPLPIFIYNEELNNAIIKIFNKSGNKLQYKEIIEELFKIGKQEEDLQNYYLLFARKGKNTTIIQDFEFVPSFQYYLKDKDGNPMVVEQIFKIDDKPDYKIDNIFQFEQEIVKDLFDNCLFKEKDEKITSNYFGDIDRKYSKTDENYRLILKYRKAFFDYIYKSKREVVKANMFKDILISGILGTLKDYEIRKTNIAKEERIKRLLNIYFSINYFFDESNSNFKLNNKTFNMANHSIILKEKILAMVKDDNKHIESDDEFAFDAGQLIYYLLYQSKASTKTHALFMPYLQRSNTNLLKEKIVNDIKRYAYDVYQSNKTFNKLCEQVLLYEPDEKSISKLTIFLLGGYFSDNVLMLKK